jgi:tRNA modification GTPase
MFDADSQDTIIAPITPAGEGGIGVLRLSGSRAEEFLQQYFHASRQTARFRSHQLYHGHMRASDGEIIDEVLAVIMRSPHSYTREDVVEVHCHGGTVVVRRLLDLFIDAGVRLARPGEFTLRAFLHGRIDLAQAEAVADIIGCASDGARRIAVGQLEGKLSAALNRFRTVVIEQLALVEVHIDFPEEDIDFPSCEQLLTAVSRVVEDIDHLLESFDAGRTLREGISLLILGKPNVGKSTLMNALLGEERAIVTAIPGTTRDIIEERFTLAGIPLRLLDTAGIRDTEDLVEREGVRRAREKIASAELILLVIDGSAPIDREDLLALDACRGSRVIVVINKSDLGTPPVSPIPGFPAVIISARRGEGVDVLQNTIRDTVLGNSGRTGQETILLSDRRHRQALLRARAALAVFRQKTQDGVAPEFLAVELRAALDAFGEITGETTPDEILNHIFSRFCIGK